LRYASVRRDDDILGIRVFFNIISSNSMPRRFKKSLARRQSGHQVVLYMMMRSKGDLLAGEQ